MDGGRNIMSWQYEIYYFNLLIGIMSLIITMFLGYKISKSRYFQDNCNFKIKKKYLINQEQKKKYK